MKKTVIYIHGRDGRADEAEHYLKLFEGCEVVGFDYKAQTPWEAEKEFPEYFDSITDGSDFVTVIANSIGAYFALSSLQAKRIDKTFLISPVADMEALIKRMLLWANVDEGELCEREEILTSFGERLSWKYLSYVRSHPIEWSKPTYILYGENDHLIALEVLTAFAERINAPLTVMPSGEHWFHTDEQMSFLDAWIKRYL